MGRIALFKSIKLNFTETGDIIVPTKGITIFVGPNNSGKSLILREIEQCFRTHPFPSNLRLIVDYEVEWPDLDDVRARIAKEKSIKDYGIPEGQFIIHRINPGGGREQGQLNEENLLSIIAAKNDHRWIATQYMKFGVLRLDGRSRFELTNDQSGGDLLEPPQNVLAHLFQDNSARLSVRSLVKDAFGLEFVIDPTNLGQLRIRLSQKTPMNDEQSLNIEARQYFRESIHIKESSDGIQAFTGIVAAARSGEYHTILIDEPEAFLHPPLARKLGKNLAALAAERGGSLLASTHSSDFLMGCVQASSSVQIVRLEYNKGKSRGRLIDSQALESLFRHPLMRSANVISGLFHDGVVVLESDNDRAFYSEIYYRIAEIKSNYPSILFVNAQNKQTIREIIGPLRRFGVPAAAIPDIDFIKDGGKTWTDWLSAAQIPVALHLGYGQQRSAINEAFKASGRDMKAEGGLSILAQDDRLAGEQLFANLEEFGVFPVRRGELESWLPELGVPGKKTDWTVAMLKRLGGDPSHISYVKPGKGDVWDFMENIISWISNSSRKGAS